MARFNFPPVTFVGDEMYVNDKINAFNRLCIGGQSQYEMMREVFDAGLKALAEQGRTKLDPVVQALLETAAEDQKLKRLCQLHSRLGEERFVKWCEDHGIDPQPVLEAPIELDFRDHRQWLDELLDDGQEYVVKDIKAAAVRSGFDSKDWRRIDAYAERRGYKKSYGVWQKE